MSVSLKDIVGDNDPLRMSDDQKRLAQIELENQQVLNRRGEAVESLFGNFNQGTQYTGLDAVPEFNDDQLAAMQQQRMNSAMYNQSIPRANRALNFGLEGVLDIGNNPYAQGAISAAVDPVMDAIMERIIPGAQSAAIQQGAYGGSRDGLMTAQAINDAAQGARRSADALAGQFYQSGLNTFSNTLNALPQTLGTYSMGSDKLMEVGDRIMARDQALRDQEIDRFNFERDAPFERAQQQANILDTLFEPPRLLPSEIPLEGQDQGMIGDLMNVLGVLDALGIEVGGGTTITIDNQIENILDAILQGGNDMLEPILGSILDFFSNGEGGDPSLPDFDGIMDEIVNDTDGDQAPGNVNDPGTGIGDDVPSAPAPVYEQVPDQPHPQYPDRIIGGEWYRWVETGNGGRMVKIDPANPTHPEYGQAQEPEPEPAPAPEPAPQPTPEVPEVPDQGDVGPIPGEDDSPLAQAAARAKASLLEQGIIGEDGYVLDERGQPTDQFYTDYVADILRRMREFRDAVEDNGGTLGPNDDIPDLPDLSLPDGGLGADNPEQDVGDLLENIGGNLGDLIGGGGDDPLASLGSSFAPTPGGQNLPTFSLPGLGTLIASELAGFGGRAIGDALFDRSATTSWGSTTGSGIGYAVGGPIGAAVGALLGGMVDSMFGTSDQKNVTAGVATTQPGDDVSGEMTLASGLKLWGINRRAGNGEVTQGYMDTIASLDKFLTESAAAAGFEVKLKNFGEGIPTFGGEVQGKGKNLKANPTFFGSATEGSGETDKNHVTKNMTEGLDRFVDSWLKAAVDQGQLDASYVSGLQGNITEKLLGFQKALGFDVEIPDFDSVDGPDFDLPLPGTGNY